MRGFHDEMGGPDSIASPSEWGPVGWGDSMTAAGLPATPAVKGYIYPGHKVTWSPDEGFVESSPSDNYDAMRRGWLIPSPRTSPSDEDLRHNHLLRRQIFDPGYGAVRELHWRKKVANGLGVECVDHAPALPYEIRRHIDRKLGSSPSDM